MDIKYINNELDSIFSLLGRMFASRVVKSLLLNMYLAVHAMVGPGNILYMRLLQKLCEKVELKGDISI